MAGVPSALIRPTRPARYRGLGLRDCGWAGARPGFISPASVVRLPGPQLLVIRSIDGTVREPGIAIGSRIRCLWVRSHPCYSDRNEQKGRRCPVVQWRRHLSHTEETGVRLPPGRLLACWFLEGSRIRLRRALPLRRFPPGGMRVLLPRLPLALMVKRRSRLGPNEESRVQVLSGQSDSERP